MNTSLPIAPPISAIKKNNHFFHCYLSLLYQDICFTNSHQKIDAFHKTHGEILFPSITKLISLIRLTAQDVFVDLGSGLGKAVTQFFLLSPVKQAIGIEISPELHQKAVMIAEKIKPDFPDFYAKDRQLTFIQGNFLEISFEAATVVLINSICFSPMMLQALGNIIEQIPNIHTVLTLRPIGNLERLPFRKAVRIECSWDSSLCYIYSTVTDFAKFLG